MERVFVSWSGGKDSCLAAYRARTRGFELACLANTVSDDGERSCSHGISSGVIMTQARAMGLPLAQQRTGQNTYEADFKTMVAGLKKSGITGGVFGDIDFEPHREWVERVCREAGVKSYLPLWGGSQEKILDEFIGLGFETVVIATQADLMGEEWLGRKVDASFLADLKKLPRPITPCGEAGEYHTLVMDGPLFRERLEIRESRKVNKDGYWFLEIARCEAVPGGKGAGAGAERR